MSRKKTILLVDDNRTSSLYLGLILKRMGFKVSYADGGQDALGLIGQVQPDIVLIEAEMPQLSGLETLAELRKLPEFANTPAIMLTGKLDKATLKHCADAGAQGCLTKPVSMGELHEILQDFVFSASGIKRKYMRVNARIKVMLFAAGAARQLTTETISEGGLYLRTDSTYVVGTDVEMSIPAPDRNLILAGRVIYVRDSYDEHMAVPPGIAVEFRNLSEVDLFSIMKLVSELMTGDMGADSEATVRHDEGGVGESVIMRHRLLRA